MPPDWTDIPPGISPSEWITLQRQFLEEGVAGCRELLEGPPPSFDAVRMAQLMHRWAGGSGQLGYHDLTQSIRATEQLLLRAPVSRPDIRERIGDLQRAFRDLCDKLAGSVPDHIAQALRGKTVALIGLPAERADRACTALGLAGALPRIFPLTDDLQHESASACDLVIVHIGAETQIARLQQAASALATGKLFLTGERSRLMALPSSLQSLATDFLFYPLEPEELLMRITLATWRQTTTPAVASPAPGVVPRLPTEIPRRVTSPRVVVVDDDSLILSLLRATLQNQGIQCQTANNGGAGLQLIQTEKPHVVVLDVNMPIMDGYEVLAAIRAAEIPTQVVLLTARQQEDDVLRGFQLGADDYLVKPFNPLELVARVKRLLRLTRQAAA